MIFSFDPLHMWTYLHAFSWKKLLSKFRSDKAQRWGKILRSRNRFRSSIFLYLAEQNSVLNSVVEIRTLYVQGEEMPEDKGIEWVKMTTFCLAVLGIGFTTEYTECMPGFLSNRPNWVHSNPSPTSGCCPSFGSKRGDTLACGGGGGGTQFRRRDRHSGTHYNLSTDYTPRPSLPRWEETS
jgi:hypothetical protein